MPRHIMIFIFCVSAMTVNTINKVYLPCSIASIVSHPVGIFGVGDWSLSKATKLRGLRFSKQEFCNTKYLAG